MSYAIIKNSMLLKIIILIPLVLTLEIQLTTYFNGKDSNHVHGLDNVTLKDFNIAAAGDWGCNANTRNTVTNIINHNPELILALGDYSYTGDPNCWLKIIDPIDHKMEITIGNHDAKEYKNKGYYPAPERLQEYMEHFNLSKQFYSFDYQNVHFIALSAEVPFEPGSDQYDFVKSDLVMAESQPNIKWIVAFYHITAYTSPTSAGGSFQKFRDTYHPLFEKYGIDLVLQAHSHTYQRSYPIKYNAGEPSQPTITDKNLTKYHDPTGQIFITAGTGGVSVIHNFTGPRAEYMAAQFKAFGFFNLIVPHNRTMLIGEFYDNNGSVKDRFSIVKSNASEKNSLLPSEYKPKLKNGFDSKFNIETIFEGLKRPSDMAFLNQNDIIVLEKNNGTVQRIVNSHILGKPLLDVNVANKMERGLLGISISKSIDRTVHVFLYYTETKDEGSDICPKPDYCVPGRDPLGNRLYRYELSQNGTKLVNPKLLLDLPAVPGPAHNGGKLIIGPDKSVFLVIGDQMGHMTKAQNYENGPEADMTGGILKVNQDGRPFNDGYLGTEYPLDLYYAYGIRNSFGIDIDPVTGNLWDTENGPEFGDEINLVKPGFNSGWKDIQGIWKNKGGKPQNVTLSLDDLVNFNGKGKYSNPELTFFIPLGLTGMKFLSSDKMGLEYENDLFVGDFNNGMIYRFELNNDRTGLELDGSLADKVAQSPNELENVSFAKMSSGITDLEVGPDGYLYVLTYKGTIYKISPK